MEDLRRVVNSLLSDEDLMKEIFGAIESIKEFEKFQLIGFAKSYFMNNQKYFLSVLDIEKLAKNWWKNHRQDSDVIYRPDLYQGANIVQLLVREHGSLMSREEIISVLRTRSDEFYKKFFKTCFYISPDSFWIYLSEKYPK